MDAEQRKKQRRMFQRYLEQLHCDAFAREMLYEDYYRKYAFRLAVLRSFTLLIGIPVTDSIFGINWDGEIWDMFIFPLSIVSAIVFLLYLIYDVFLGLGMRCSKLRYLIEEVKNIKADTSMLWYKLFGEGMEIDENIRVGYVSLLQKMSRVSSDDNDAIIWGLFGDKKYKASFKKNMKKATIKSQEVLAGIVKKKKGGES